MASYWNDTAKQYHPTVNRPDMPPASGTILHDPASAPGLVSSGVPFTHWKISGSDVAEMSAAEKLAVDQYLDTFRVETLTGGKTSKVEWFETDNGDGTYSDLAREETHTWSTGKLSQVVARRLHKDGSVVAGTTETLSYYTTSAGKHVTKVT